MEKSRSGIGVQINFNIIKKTLIWIITFYILEIKEKSWEIL